MIKQVAVIALALGLAACNSGGNGGAGADNAALANRAATAPAAADNASAETGAAPGLAACPFRKTRDWKASIMEGNLLVNGKVDLMMAGFKPVLTKRETAAPGVAAFDLALVPETGAVVSNSARYEEKRVPRYTRAEIYCGGERIAEVAMVHVVD
jgi:hypothetical protein